MHYKAVRLGQDGVVPLQNVKLLYDKTLAIDAGVNVLGVQLSSGQQLQINGGFQIDTSSLTLGSVQTHNEFLCPDTESELCLYR